MTNELAAAILGGKDQRKETTELTEKLLQLNQAMIAKMAELGLEFAIGQELGGRYSNPPWDGPQIFHTFEGEAAGYYKFTVKVTENL